MTPCFENIYGRGQRIFIIDAGSSKTQVVILQRNSNLIIKEFELEAINPVHLSDEEIIAKICPLKDFALSGDDVAYFGAGCFSEATCRRTKDALRRIGFDGSINIASDIIASGLSLFGRREGIACILGTGSNTSFFKDGAPIASVPSLGYILGDEGSGASIGKRLLKSILRKDVSESIYDLFMKETDQDYPKIIECIYRGASPNKYLAHFTHFVSAHIQDKEIEDIVIKEFSELFKNQISKYDNYKNVPIGFTGSVAKIFEPQLKQVARNFGCSIETISKYPLEGLINYFRNNRL